MSICNGHLLHQAGFKGEGIIIGVIDAGFHRVDRLMDFEHANIAGAYNFVDGDEDVFHGDDHGTKVLSCMAANEPNKLIGTAPHATYWLFRTEDSASEQPVEEDFWAAAIEYADSVGVDVINSSLGYFKYDDPQQSYRYRDLDGKSGLVSRQASRAADKGMVVCISAGNQGTGPLKKINPPADAANVLTVGAVNAEGVLAPFSSVGNTADGRVKPDVMAMGEGVAVIYAEGIKGSANGTSFAAPIVSGLVACLWQARPELTARQVIALVRMTAGNAECPDNIYGYGIADFGKALLWEDGIPEAED